MSVMFFFLLSEQPPSEVQWLISELSRGNSVGADPRLLSAKDWLYIDEQLRGEGTNFAREGIHQRC